MSSYERIGKCFRHLNCNEYIFTNKDIEKGKFEIKHPKKYFTEEMKRKGEPVQLGMIYLDKDLNTCELVGFILKPPKNVGRILSAKSKGPILSESFYAECGAAYEGVDNEA